MTPSFTLEQVSAFRMARQGLAGRSPAALATLCRDACGIQAQVLGAAYLALSARKHGLSRAEIDSALWQRREMVKTSAMRGTLHLLAAGDFTIYIRALQSSRIRQMRRVMSYYGSITSKEAEGVRDAVVEALAGGPATRRELQETVLALGIVSKKARKYFESGWWGVARQALVEGLICYGPDRGKDTTLVRTDQWLHERKPVNEQEAEQELLRRYLSAYGPATLRDFSRWTGMAVADARPIWDSVREELEEVAVGETKGALLKVDVDRLSDSGSGESVVRLLPTFDPYMLGHAGKDHLVDERHYKRVYRGAGWISAVVLLDGKVIGVWSHAGRGKRVSLKIEPFQRLSKGIRAGIEEEAARLGRFLETDVEMTVAV
jgi:uncharacterized protein YcaQ